MPSLTVAVAMLKEREQTLMIVNTHFSRGPIALNSMGLSGLESLLPRLRSLPAIRLFNFSALGITSLEVIACNDELEGFKPRWLRPSELEDNVIHACRD
jgi:hypothetical protein